MLEGEVDGLAVHEKQFGQSGALDGLGQLLQLAIDDVGGLHVVGIVDCVEEFDGDGRTCLCIGEGVMVVLQAVSATFGDDVEVVATTRPYTAGLEQRAMELIVGIIHVIATEDRLEAILVKGFVVGNQRKTLDQRRNLSPYLGEGGGMTGVTFGKAMHLGAPEVVVVGLRLDERIERIDYLAISYNNNTHRAYTRGFVVGCLKVYSSKISHQDMISG